MDTVAARWKAELDEKLDRARQAHGQRLPKELDVALREQFWRSVDERLDELEQNARESLRKR